MGEDIPRSKGFEEFAQLMWDNKKDLQAELSNDKKSVKLWLDGKGYLPEGVFAGWIDVASKLATKDKNGNKTAPKDAISLFCQIKVEILQLIIAINFLADENNIEKRNYSDILSNVDSFINWAISLLDSEMKSNQIEANRISKKTNRYIAVFTAFAGGWYLYDFMYRIAAEDTIIRHFTGITPHYKNIKFIPCILIVAITIWCINTRLEKAQNSRKEIE